MPIITIARETGAGGSDVGRQLADRLGIELVDAALIDEVARRLRLPRSEVEAEDEQPRSLLERLVRGAAMSEGPMGLGASMGAAVPPDPHDAVVALSGQIIREAARSGDAVIVGRGACFVLGDVPGAIHVFLCAPVEVRVRRLAALWSVSEDEARRRLQADDAHRHTYVRQVHGREWRDPANYHLCVDTGRVSYAEAVDLVLTLAARRAAGPRDGAD